MLLNCVGKLISARSFLLVAADTFESPDDFGGFHSFRQIAQGFKVAIAAILK